MSEMSLKSSSGGFVLSSRGWFWLIVGVGMALRLAWAIAIPVEPVSDSVAYDTFARTLVEHGVYGWTADQPGAFWAVGTSAIAAFTYLLFGYTYAGIVGLNLLASLIIIVLGFRLGEIYFGRPHGHVAAAILALWPNLILFTTILSSELYFLALVTAGLYFWERREGAPWANLVVCGLIWGAACYIRPVILLLPVAVALAGAVTTRRYLAEAGRAIAVMAIILACVSPWTYRNTLLFGEPVLVSTNFGPNFWMGNNPQSNGGYMEMPDWVRDMGEVERAHALSAVAKAYVAEDPLRFVGNTLVKAVKLHNRETIGVWWNGPVIERMFGHAGTVLLKILSNGYWFWIAALALGGIAMLVATRGFLGFFHPAIGGWAYFTLLHAIIVVEDRYHMPSSTFIALLAALPFTHFCRRIAARRQTVSG